MTTLLTSGSVFGLAHILSVKSKTVYKPRYGVLQCPVMVREKTRGAVTQTPAWPLGAGQASRSAPPWPCPRPSPNGRRDGGSSGVSEGRRARLEGANGSRGQEEHCRHEHF